MTRTDKTRSSARTSDRTPDRRRRMQPRPRLALLFTLATATVASATCMSGSSAEPMPPAVRIWNGKDEAVTEGEVEVGGTPEAVFAALTTYSLWPDIFPYVGRIDIKSGSRDDIVLDTISRKKGTRHTLRFHNDSRRLIVRFEEQGGRADVKAELALEPGRTSGTTRLRAKLYADVHGAISLFVSDSRIRQKREHKLSTDLEHIRVYFDH